MAAAALVALQPPIDKGLTASKSPRTTVDMSAGAPASPGVCYWDGPSLQAATGVTTSGSPEDGL